MNAGLDWLEPVAVEPVLLAVPEETALRWALLDGLLLPAAPGELAATDLLRDAAGRARSLGNLVPAGAALARASAVWVHTGRHRPGVPEVVVPRTRREQSSRLRVHTHPLGPGDTVVLGGVRVTSLCRTGADVARWAPDAVAVAQLADLLAVGLSAAEVRAHLDGLRGQPRTVRARAVISLLLDPTVRRAP